MPESPESSLTAQLSLAGKIDALCDRFEREWVAAQNPRIEDYLAQGDIADRSLVLRALLEVELELLYSSAIHPDAEAYCRRFPDHPEVVQSVLKEASSWASNPDVIAAEKTATLLAADVATSRLAAELSLSNETPLPPPERIGRFEVLQVLGEGAFGTVYRARDPHLEREVAIKLPRAGMLATDNDRQRFLREAKIAATLHHPHICPVFEVGELEGHPFIVMALIEGKTLADLIRRGTPITPRQAVATVRRIALALAEAHGKGIVHRDLKPANIMANRRGEPIVMDFGLARLHKLGDARLTHSGQIMGSPAYMSPEQARGATDQVGPATDIYSLGVILYELLCGQRPFTGTVTEVLGQILHVEPRPPPRHKADLAPSLEAICLKAMAKKPAARFASMTELAAALTEYLKGAAAATAQGAAATKAASETEPGASRLQTALAEFAAEQRSLTRRAVAEAARDGVLAGRGSWWMWLVASGLMAVIVLLGILFFAKTPTATVFIQVDVDVTDPALAFFMDGKIIEGVALVKPIELTAGKHELVVNRGETVIRRYEFEVNVGMQPEIVLRDATPPDWPIADVPAPIVHYAFEDRDALTRDDRGRVSRGKVIGVVEQAPGRVGLAAKFTRGKNYINLADDPAFDVYEHFTAAAWIKGRSDLARILGRWFQKGDSFRLVATGVDLHAEFAFSDDQGGRFPVGVQAPYDANAWTHVAAAFTGEHVRLYLNGALASEARVADHPAIGQLKSVQATGQAPRRFAESDVSLAIGPNFEGLIDEVMLFDRALDEAALQRLIRYQTEDPAKSKPMPLGPYALEFDGQGDGVVLPIPAIPKTCTVEAWVTPQHRARAYQFAVRADFPEPRTIYFHSNTPNGLLKLGFGGLDKTVWRSSEWNGPDPPLEGRLMHIAGVWWNGTPTLFVDGRKRAGLHSHTEVSRQATNRWYIGAQSISDSGAVVDGLVGTVHAVRISDNACYTADFKPQGDWSADEHTVALYRFREGKGAELKDSSGRGHYGWIVGAKWISTTAAPGSPDRRVAAEPREGVPASPLDQLGLQNIPAAERFPWQPPELVAVFGEHRSTHWGTVHTIAVSPDDKLVASGGEDGFIHLSDPKTLQRVGTLTGHEGPVHSLAFVPGQNQIVSAGADGTLRLWDVAGRRELQKLIGRKGPVYTVAALPGGAQALSGGSDASVRLWDLAAGKELRKFDKATKAVWKIVMAGDGTRVLSGGDDRLMRFWDLETGEDLVQFEIEWSGYHEFKAIAISKDGSRAFSGSSQGEGKFSSMRIWDTATGKMLRRTGRIVDHPVQIDGHGVELTRPGSVAISPDGMQILTGVHSPADGNDLIIWDIRNGDVIRRFGKQATFASAVAFSPDGRRVYTGSQHGRLRAWDAETGADLAPFTGHESFLFSVALSPDSQQLLTAGEDLTVRFWDTIHQQKELLVYRAADPSTSYHTPWQALFSPTGDRALFFGGRNGHLALLWEPAEWKPIAEFHKTNGDEPVYLAMLSPEGRKLLNDFSTGLVLDDGHSSLALLSDERAVGAGHDRRLLDNQRGPVLVRLFDRRDGRELKTIAPFPGFMGLAVSENYIAVADLSGGAVKLYDADLSGERTLGNDVGPSIAFSLDGAALATANRAGRIVLWSPATGEKLREFKLPGAVHSLAFDATGRYLATGNANGTAYLLRLAPSPKR